MNIRDSIYIINDENLNNDDMINNFTKVNHEIEKDLKELNKYI